VDRKYLRNARLWWLHSDCGRQTTDAHSSRHDGPALTEVMGHRLRSALRLVAVITFAVMIAASAWLLLRPPGGRAADCATAHAMWTYYESQLASERAAAQEPSADNNQTEVAYQNMVNELQDFANRITTPDIRAEADTIVAINRDMFEQWKRWVAESRSESPVSTGPAPSDRRFGSAFAENARKLKTAHAELERTCGS
jgi:hypothetical protein